MLGVDRVVDDGRVEPQPVALLAVIECSLERRAGAAGLSPAAAAAAAPLRRRRLGLLALGIELGRRGARSAASASAASLARLLGSLELGRDLRVVLGAQIDLVVECGRRRRRRRSSSSSPASRLKLAICCTVTSSWWATQASVRPWRVQVRIWLRWGRSDLRAIGGKDTSAKSSTARGARLHLRPAPGDNAPLRRQEREAQCSS